MIWLVKEGPSTAMNNQHNADSQASPESKIVERWQAALDEAHKRLGERMDRERTFAIKVIWIFLIAVLALLSSAGGLLAWFNISSMHDLEAKTHDIAMKNLSSLAQTETARAWTEEMRRYRAQSAVAAIASLVNSERVLQVDPQLSVTPTDIELVIAQFTDPSASEGAFLDALGILIYLMGMEANGTAGQSSTALNQFLSKKEVDGHIAAAQRDAKRYSAVVNAIREADFGLDPRVARTILDSSDIGLVDRIHIASVASVSMDRQFQTAIRRTTEEAVAHYNDADDVPMMLALQSLARCGGDLVWIDEQLERMKSPAHRTLARLVCAAAGGDDAALEKSVIDGVRANLQFFERTVVPASVRKSVWAGNNVRASAAAPELWLRPEEWVRVAKSVIVCTARDLALAIPKGDTTAALLPSLDFIASSRSDGSTGGDAIMLRFDEPVNIVSCYDKHVMWTMSQREVFGVQPGLSNGEFLTVLVPPRRSQRDWIIIPNCRIASGPDAGFQLAPLHWSSGRAYYGNEQWYPER